jgi:hypothetical protein
MSSRSDVMSLRDPERILYSSLRMAIDDRVAAMIA